MNKLSEVMQSPLLSGEEVSEVLIANNMKYGERASTKQLAELLYCSQRNAQLVLKDGFSDRGLQALFYLQMQLTTFDK